MGFIEGEWEIVKFPPYTWFYEDLAPQEVLKGLLLGIFPNQLPSIISAVDYADYAIADLEHLKPNLSYDYIRFMTLRNTNVMRRMGIPTPQNHAALCSHISQHWELICDHIEKHTKNQTHKVSRIHIRKSSNAGRLFNMSYKNFDLDGYPGAYIPIYHKYTVSIDIAQFFPSIYSHSLPWAIVGKDIARKNQGDDLWYNKFDRLLRNCKNQETNGILIGPDTSSVISEMLLCVVDGDLVEKGYSYIRNIDDYTCYCRSLEEAERFIKDARKSLGRFELSLNDKKTAIVKSPSPMEAAWISVLQRHNIKGEYSIGDSGKSYLKVLGVRNIWSLAEELFLAHDENSAIINYTIKIIYKYELGYNALRFYLDRLLHMAILYPYLCPLLEEFVFDRYRVVKSEIRRFSNYILEIGLVENNEQMCLYAMVWAVKYKYSVEFPPELSQVFSFDDPVFNLVDYLYMVENKSVEAIEMHRAHMQILAKSSFSRNWLYLYEGLPAKFLHKSWKRMKRRGVNFVNISEEYAKRRETYHFLELYLTEDDE